MKGHGKDKNSEHRRASQPVLYRLCGLKHQLPVFTQADLVADQLVRLQRIITEGMSNCVSFCWQFPARLLKRACSRVVLSNARSGGTGA